MAAVTDRSTSWDISTDTSFRAWVQAVHDAISGAGLVQTADTGQINPATVTVPATETSAGYEIWRFNDAAQASSPIFIRVQYERGDSAGMARLRLIVGRGSNGSGTISDAAVSGPIVNTRDDFDTASRFIHASLHDSAFVLAAGAGVGVGAFIFAIERVKDSGGNLTGEIVALLSYDTAAVFVWSGTAWNAAEGVPTFPGRYADADGEWILGRIHPSDTVRAIRLPPLRSLLLVPVAAANTFDEGDATVDGVTGHFLVTALWSSLSGQNVSGLVGSTVINNTALNIAVRDE